MGKKEAKRDKIEEDKKKRLPIRERWIKRKKKIERKKTG